MVEQSNAAPESDEAGAAAQTESGERRGAAALGPLELQLMSALWDAAGPLSVQGVIGSFGPGRNYKTVMTVLNRLVAKGLLERHLDGRAYRYGPRQQRGEFLRSAADELVRNYLASYGDSAAGALAEAVSVCDRRSAAVAAEAPAAPQQRSAIGDDPPASAGAPGSGLAGTERTPTVALVLAVLGLEAAILLVGLARRGAR